MVNKNLKKVIEGWGNISSEISVKERSGLPGTAGGTTNQTPSIDHEEIILFCNILTATKIRDSLSKKVKLNGALLESGIRDVKKDPKEDKEYSKQFIYSHSNASYGILEYLLNNEKNAKTIRDSLVQHTKFEGVLIGESLVNPAILLHSNSTYAILEYLCGNVSTARSIRNELIGKIGISRSGLMGLSVKDPAVNSYANSTFGVLEFLLGNTNHSNKIYSSLIREIGCFGGLVKWDKNEIEDNKMVFKGYAQANAFFGTLNYLVGDLANSKTIMKGIKEKIGFSEDLINYCIGNNSISTSANSAMGIFCLAYKLKKCAMAPDGQFKL